MQLWRWQINGIFACSLRLMNILKLLSTIKERRFLIFSIKKERSKKKGQIHFPTYVCATKVAQPSFKMP